MVSVPRFMICAAGSGSGKTTVTCGILQAFINRGLSTGAFKCGPDYIDPMFHTKVIGAKSRNIDTFFADENTVKYLLVKNSRGNDINVIEGVMGYYDGIANTSNASSYDVARVTGTPAVLLVNAAGMSVSSAAIVKGFMAYREDSNIKGVILNMVSPSIYGELKENIEQTCGVKVYGYLPKNRDISLESRHLGLVMPGEIEDLKAKLGILADEIEKTIDLEGLIALGKSAPDVLAPEIEIPEAGRGVRIGVAADEAFCFYYQDNLDLLTDMGAELVPFSPIHDSEIPEGISGLIFGGGYPELCLEKLSENAGMRSSVKSAVERGVPCIAECGGFMYLHTTVEDTAGKKYSMCDVIDGNVYYTGKLGRFGYILLTSNGESIFGGPVTQLRGHEFHYYDSTNNGELFTAQKPHRKKSWRCGHGNGNLICGFPHYYFYSNIPAVGRFLEHCRRYGETLK